MIFLTVFMCIWDLSACVCGADDPVMLKDVFASKFMIGAALNKEQIYGMNPAELALVERHFNTVTPENVLKWEKVQPEPGKFIFDPMDKLMEFADKNGMSVLGHVLIWHEQTPDWVFIDADGKLLSRGALLARMKKHIFAVMGRYKGRIGGWDVINEAVGDDGSLRKTKWLEIIGPDYIDKAFEYARAADPSAELYYNDYDMWKKPKREGVVKLVKELQAKGLRVDGIGIQAHWGLDYPELDEIEESIKAFAGLGMKVVVTEMDVTALPNPWKDTSADISKRFKLSDQNNPYPNGLPEPVQMKLAERYSEFFELFVKYSDVINRVTFWGVQDGNSWRNNWPVQGRTDYTLVFDRQCQPKPAFDAIIKIKD